LLVKTVDEEEKVWKKINLKKCCLENCQSEFEKKIIIITWHERALVIWQHTNNHTTIDIRPQSIMIN